MCINEMTAKMFALPYICNTGMAMLYNLVSSAVIVLHILLGMHVETCGIQNRQHRQKEKQSRSAHKEDPETVIHRLPPL